MKQIPIYRNRTIIAYSLVDDDDYSRLCPYYWGLTDQGYAIRYYHPVPKQKRVSVRMHRAILNPLDEELIDHKNGNRLDNRKENLRIIDNKGNVENRTRLNKNNKSGYRGVSWMKSKRKWRAVVMHNRQQIHCGLFDSPEAANLAGIAKRQELDFKN